MKKNSDITVIIPLHTLDMTTTYLEKAIDSVKQQTIAVKEILIVVPESISKDLVLKTFLEKDVKLIVNKGKTDFCSQVNFGVSQTKSKYFSILELDDEYSKTYFENVDKYVKAYPSVSAFLPVLVMVNAKNQALQYVNEAVWASGFSEKMGYLDITILQQYDNFMISGGVFLKDSFEEVGGLKGDIKLYFNYEFLLRFINNDFTTMVIPKLGYMHLVDRENSLFMEYKDPTSGIKADEARFYLGAAKQEYFFNPNEVKRTIEYSSAESN